MVWDYQNADCSSQNKFIVLFIILFGTFSFHIAGSGIGARQCLRFRTQNPSRIVVYFRAEMATFTQRYFITFQYSLDLTLTLTLTNILTFWPQGHCMPRSCCGFNWLYFCWYDTRCYYDVRSKADINQPNLKHRTNNYKVENRKTTNYRNGYAQKYR